MDTLIYLLVCAFAIVMVFGLIFNVGVYTGAYFHFQKYAVTVK